MDAGNVSGKPNLFQTAFPSLSVSLFPTLIDLLTDMVFFRWVWSTIYWSSILQLVLYKHVIITIVAIIIHDAKGSVASSIDCGCWAGDWVLFYEALKLCSVVCVLSSLQFASHADHSSMFYVSRGLQILILVSIHLICLLMRTTRRCTERLNVRRWPCSTEPG